MSGMPPLIYDHLGRPIARASTYNPAYESASTGRIMSNYATSQIGPNSAVVEGLSVTRSRARHLRRNNPWIDGGADTFIAYLVGTSISPRWKLRDKADKQLKKDLQQLWSESQLEMDYDELTSFYGLQELIAGAFLDSGESLVRFHILPKNSGQLVPFQVQVLEADHLDHTYFGMAQNGNEIRYGIEFNSRQKKVAYWPFKEHPGESYGFLPSYSGERVRIPASEMNLIFRPTRPGQSRGIPWLKSAIVRAHILDNCEHAELVRRTVAGLFGGYIKKPPVDEDATPPRLLGTPDTSNQDYSATLNPIQAMEPGTFPELPPGWEVQFASPPDPGAGFFDLAKHHLRAMGKSYGNTYEKQTGDLEKVNFSSIRAGQNDFLQLIEMIQHHTIIFQACRPVVNTWLDVVAASGVLGTVFTNQYAANKRKFRDIEWVPDSPPRSPNPLQAAMTDLLERRAGYTSRARQIAARGNRGGGDIEKIDAEIKEENDRADENGFVFDSDPRRTAKAGTYQDTEQKPDGSSF